MSIVRCLRGQLSNVAVVALLGAWFVTLAPTVIGGPAAYIEVSGHSMDGTYATGDLVVTRKQDTYEVGDIVTFEVAGGGRVIHRIIGGDGARGYTMQGDNNPTPDPWQPTDDEVVGASWLYLPQKAWVLHLPQHPWFPGVAAGLATLLVLGWDSRPRRKDQEQVDACDRPTPAPASVTVPAPDGRDLVLVAAGVHPFIPTQRTGDHAELGRPALTALRPTGRRVPAPRTAAPRVVLRPTGRRVPPPPPRKVLVP
ncbi:signal peptidase I [Nocardioides aurantiacus]|uniref:Signal peptidase I n=1 Tax=Nocardioides aurantiacus TaxID=86796 RepID=A0A3N2CYX2_9ACTN|nr:signal peptidase I [Nocardioides aurantiacus]ROR92729.1 signal peptidase I [Nocardioides aurantiacus]